MNTVIANQLKGKILSTITWADRVVGMVRPLTYVTGSEIPVVNTIPISCDLEASQRDCISNKQHHVVPDSSLKALIYFEDGGCAPTGKSVRGLSFTSSITLVCWMNLQKLGKTDCSASAFGEAQLIEALYNFQETVSPINTIKVTQVSIAPKSPGIFSRYTYDQTALQYLIYPYDYFALDLKISFEVPFGCIDNSWVETEIPCSTN